MIKEDKGAMQPTRTHDDRRVVALEVADDFGELPAVRAWAHRVLRDLPEHQRLDVVLVLDELTSNALRHGEPPRQVRLLRKRGWICLEVDDACLDPACRRTPSDSGGHGLEVVDAITVSWGQRQRSTGKTVWAEIDLTRPADHDD